MTETCPSCKSNDRDVRRDADCDGYDSPCTYSWHDAKEEKMAEQFGVNRPGDTIPGIGNTSERAPAQATREQLAAALESEEFYSLMQEYRFAPLANQSEVTRSFEAVKQFIRERLLGGK